MPLPVATKKHIESGRLRLRKSAWRALCAAKGKTYAQMAADLQYHKSAISQYLNGNPEPPRRFIVNLLRIAGGKFEDYFEVV